MLMKKKERYLSPEIEVMDLTPQGVICGSNVDVTGTTVGAFPDPFGGPGEITI